MILRSVILIIASITTAAADDPFSFIVLADWHGAESFAAHPVTRKNDDDGTQGYHAAIEVLSHINENYGGDLVLLPGDTNSGKWYKKEFIAKISEKHGPVTSNQAIAIAGNNCYSTTKRIFKKAGYDKVLLAVGDHEIGDNPWKSGTPVVDGLPEYRDAIATHFNQDKNGKFLYDKYIGKIPSRPIGTIYEDTSFALIHRNVMFVTVDVFNVMENDHYDRKNMSGGEGVVSGNVKGKHLTWFTDIINAGCKDSSIKHIFVQSHLPVLEPVRKINSSSMPFDQGTDNEFWTVMQKCVDVYFAGEVHALTATKDRDSDLVQVVSRGNRFSNFIKVDVTDDKISIEAHNEIGTLWRWNKKYTKYGQLTIDKSEKETKVEGSGALTLLDMWGSNPLISFLFEQNDIYNLADRQILGFKYDDYQDRLIGTKVTIQDDIISSEGMENHGAFGRQYDAQIANLGFDKTNAIQGESSGVFTSNTIVAIGSMGPLVAGEIFYLGLFFKTMQSGETILVSFSPAWGGPGPMDMLLLTLKEGVPVLYIDEKTWLQTLSSDVVLNDGLWHHISARMLEKSCKLSDVVVDVDGSRIDTTVVGNDEHLFFKSTSHLTLGGWGYSHKNYGTKLFSKIENFVGSMDKFLLSVGKKISAEEISQSSQREFIVHKDTPCVWDGSDANSRIFVGKVSTKWKKCSKTCRKSPSCLGYMILPHKYKENTSVCYHYTKRPQLHENRTIKGAECAISV